MNTERYALVKIKAPTEEQTEQWRDDMGTRPWVGNKERGLQQTGPLFRGDHVVCACAQEFVLEIVCRVLTQARVAYSVEAGKLIVRRKKKCGSSTSSKLTALEITLELVSDRTNDCTSTTPGSATAPEDAAGGQ